MPPPITWLMPIAVRSHLPRVRRSAGDGDDAEDADTSVSYSSFVTALGKRIAWGARQIWELNQAADRFE